MPLSVYVLIKENPDLVESCNSENSEIVDERDIHNLKSALEKQYEQFLSESRGRVNSEPPSRVLTSIRIQLETHEQDFKLFLERKEAFESFYLHWHPQKAAKLMTIEKTFKTIEKRMRRAEIFYHQNKNEQAEAELGQAQV